MSCFTLELPHDGMMYVRRGSVVTVSSKQTTTLRTVDVDYRYVQIGRFMYEVADTPDNMTKLLADMDVPYDAGR